MIKYEMQTRIERHGDWALISKEIRRHFLNRILPSLNGRLRKLIGATAHTEADFEIQRLQLAEKLRSLVNALFSNTLL